MVLDLIIHWEHQIMRSLPSNIRSSQFVQDSDPTSSFHQQFLFSTGSLNLGLGEITVKASWIFCYYVYKYTMMDSKGIFSVLYWKRFMNRYSQGTYTMSWLSNLSIVYIAYSVMFEKSALNCWLKLKSEHKLFVGLRRNLLFSLINISYTTSRIFYATNWIWRKIFNSFYWFI